MGMEVVEDVTFMGLHREELRIASSVLGVILTLATVWTVRHRRRKRAADEVLRRGLGR